MLMKRILPLLFFLMAPLCLDFTFAEDAAPRASGNNAEAESVMNQYFGALVNGDVTTLKALLGGGLLKKRSRLLDNQDYPGYLAATYVNATFEMLNFDTSAPNTVLVEALIRFGQDEYIRKWYALKKSGSQGGNATYRIVSESNFAR